MDTILVTGGTGLLGSTLVPYLASRGYDVVSLDRAGRGDIEGDLTDAARTMRILREVRPTTIINLVGATNVDACERNPAMAYRENTLSVGNLAAWIGTESRACHLVHISTDQVYGGDGPHDERSICLVNYYAFSKYAGELLAAQVGATVLRTNLFGRSHCPTRSSFSDWLVDRLRRNEVTPVFQDVLFSPLSLETLSTMIERAITARRAGTFNVGARLGMSKADFAFCLARTIRLSSTNLVRRASAEASLAATRPADMRMRCELFETTFGVELPSLEAEIDLLRSAYDE